MRKLAEFLKDTEQLGVVVTREEDSLAGESEADKLKGMAIKHIAGPYRPSVPPNSQSKCRHDQLCQLIQSGMQSHQRHSSIHGVDDRGKSKAIKELKIAYQKTYRRGSESNATKSITYDHNEKVSYAKDCVQKVLMFCAPLRLQSREMQPRGGGVQGYLIFVQTYTFKHM